jgi:hypothetical protein
MIKDKQNVSVNKKKSVNDIFIPLNDRIRSLPAKPVDQPNIPVVQRRYFFQLKIAFYFAPSIT